MSKNYEYIGVEGAIIDENFLNPEELLGNFYSAVGDNLSELCTPVADQDGNYGYKEFAFGEEYSRAKGKVEGVYENGVVFEFKTIVGADPHEKVTTAYCVVNKDKVPVFVVSGIDGRYEPNRALGNMDNSTVKISVNIAALNDLRNNLGTRVDGNGYIGERKEPNFLNKNRVQQQLNLKFNRIRLSVTTALEQIGSSSGRTRT